MKIKLALSAIALALLPCLPAKADFFTAAVTKNGWWEVDTDSIEHLDNGTARFVTRSIRQFRVDSVSVELVDCWNPRIMYLAFYNLDAQMWRDNPNPRWYPIKRNSAGNMIQAFVCSTPGN
jgi:hypothetical protein